MGGYGGGNWVRGSYSNAKRNYLYPQLDDSTCLFSIYYYIFSENINVSPASVHNCNVQERCGTIKNKRITW